jgi:GNAT superfamily N-acetyltransferase
MNSGELDDSHVDALAAFFARLPESDITFIKEDLSATSLQSWVSPGRSGHRWVATDDLCVVGFVALLPLSGWSSHVGDLRLVVDPDQRGRGIGTIAMFNNLGFNGEALLEDHIRDRKGEFQDLVLLSHRVDESWAAMITAGIDEALAD